MLKEGSKEHQNALFHHQLGRFQGKFKQFID